MMFDIIQKIKDEKCFYSIAFAIVGAIISLWLNFSNYVWLLESFIMVNANIVVVAFIGVYWFLMLAVLIFILAFYIVIGVVISQLLLWLLLKL